MALEMLLNSPSMEKELAANTAAMTKLTETLLNGRAPAGATVTQLADAKRPPGRPKKITIDEVKVVAQKVVDEKGRPVYFNFLKGFDAKQLADLEESKYPAFIAAAEVLLAQQADPEPEESAEL